MLRLIKRLADEALRREAAELRAKVQALTAENENLALVLARDRARIQAEIAAYASQRSQAEGSTPDERAR